MNARFLSFLGTFLMIAISAFAHESPIDHVERDLQLNVKNGKLMLIYRLQPTERAALMELKQMDGNADGKISDAERDAYFAALAESIAKKFTLTLDKQPLTFAVDGKVKRDGKLGQTFRFVAPLPPLKPGRHEGLLVDGHSREYPGAFRWKQAGGGSAKEIRVEPLTLPDDPRIRQHPPWLELKFEIVVPE